ncbi:MAG: methylated-DNA--[protein]-cysteine S-methyltransferase [Candidatus Omnitrophica bacterium]|nr:methylated-DNA--[protein]-cysteine S-methyltransferase [Candidatus Omnitrophota bacterium]
MTGNLLSEIYRKSPLGWIKIAGDREGIAEVAFVGRPSAPRGLPVPAPLWRCARELGEYFRGRRTKFTVPLRPRGTAFQIRVWKKLGNVRFARSISYRELAASVGNAAAARAVGGALNKNKVAVVIPCHRVLGRDGALTGYASGLRKKRWLLNHERATVSNKNSGGLI